MTMAQEEWSPRVLKLLGHAGGFASEFDLEDLLRLVCVDEILQCDAADALDREKIAAQAAFTARTDEPIAWLQNVMSETCPRLSEQLVAHRGFHDPEFGLDRPVEGSLSSYAGAWGAGVRLCECDVRVTGDGYLVLAHDDTLLKAAADPSDPVASMSVASSTLDTLRSLDLRGGERLSLLSDVLQVALQTDGKMVVEMKSQAGAGAALARFFRDRPELREACELVMSFDADLLLEFVAERAKEDRSIQADPPVMLLMCSLPEQSEGPEELILDWAGDRRGDVERWLAQGLDGIYVAWRQEFSGALEADFRALCHMCGNVGVWQEHGQTDCEAEALRLLDLGARYVNTDFPHSFRQHV